LALSFIFPTNDFIPPFWSSSATTAFSPAINQPIAHKKLQILNSLCLCFCLYLSIFCLHHLREMRAHFFLQQSRTQRKKRIEWRTFRSFVDLRHFRSSSFLAKQTHHKTHQEKKKEKRKSTEEQAKDRKEDTRVPKQT
jgi:hypothetical protein